MDANDWGIDISKVDGPRYLAVAGEIARAIDSGELPPGAQLPPQRDLAARLGVTVGTVSRAYALARKRRLIVGEVGRGTFVQGLSQAERSDRFIPRKADSGIDLSSFGASLSETLNQQIVRAFSEVSERASMLPLHRYATANGATSHRLAGTAWMARAGLDVAANNVLVMNGAQEALSVCLMTVARRGDSVLTEELTYSGLKSLSTAHGLRLQGVAMDEHGMRPDALENAASQSGARVLYLQPTIHNPTAASMPEARRRQIASVARRLDLLLIEDDAAASCLTERPAPISAHIPDRSCYITSLSKSVSPALRVGYVAAQPPLIAALTDAFHTLTLGVSALTAEVAALLIGNGGAAEIAQSYLDSMTLALGTVRQTLPARSVQGRAGAFYFWLVLPEGRNADDFVRAAAQQAIVIPYVDSFLVEGAAMRRGVRVSLNTSLPPDVFRKTLARLGELTEAQPQPRQTVV